MQHENNSRNPLDTIPRRAYIQFIGWEAAQMITSATIKNAIKWPASPALFGIKPSLFNPYAEVR